MNVILRKLQGSNFLKFTLILSLISLFAVIYIFFYISHRAFRIEYRITPDTVQSETLSVDIKIYRNRLFGRRSLTIAKGPITPLEQQCSDDLNRPVIFQDNNGFININSISKDVKYIDYTYKVKVGQPGSSGHQGAFYDDLLVFNGDSVLMFPYINSENVNDIGSYISSVSVKVDLNNDWKSIMPYKNINNSKENETIIIQKPDLIAFSNLSKSCYAFGDFQEFPISINNNTFNIFVDNALKHSFPKESEEIMTNIYNFYSTIFGQKLDDYSVVLLRKDPTDNGYIDAGIGGKSMGLTIDPLNIKDWKTFSHSLYHAFFDSKIKAENLRFPPNIWLYKGLATYYETLALDAFPTELKSMFGLSSENGFKELYNRYLYFRLKEPGIFTISPVNEKALSGGQAEYFYYTEGPIVVKMIEKLASEASGKKDNILNFLLKHSKDKKIDVAKLMFSLIGKSEESVRNYLSGKELMPYPGNQGIKDDAKLVVQQMDSYERLLYTWFAWDYPNYPYDEVFLLNPNKVMEETNARGLKFSTDVNEKLVSEYSPTLFLLLRQQALRASICGEKNLDNSVLRFNLFKQDNISKWREFMETSGLLNMNDGGSINGN